MQIEQNSFQSLTNCNVFCSSGWPIGWQLMGPPYSWGRFFCEIRRRCHRRCFGVFSYTLVKFLHFSLFNLCPLPLAFWISTLVSGIFTMHLGVTLYVILFSHPGHSESQRVIVDLKWLGASWLDSSRQRCFKDNGPAQTKGSFFAATPFCNLCAPNPSRILQPRGVVSASKILHSGYPARLQVLEGFQSEGTVYGAPNS